MNPEQVVSMLTNDSRINIRHIARHETLVHNGRGPYEITEKIHELEKKISEFVEKHWAAIYEKHISSSRYGFSGSIGDISINGYRVGETLLLELKHDMDSVQVTGKENSDMSLYNINATLNDAVMIIEAASFGELDEYEIDDSVTLI